MNGLVDASSISIRSTFAILPRSSVMRSRRHVLTVETRWLVKTEWPKVREMLLVAPRAALGYFQRDGRKARY